MPARKNRPNKYGDVRFAELTGEERDYLMRWFAGARNVSIWIDKDDYVWGFHGYDHDKGALVRSAARKGYLFCFRSSYSPTNRESEIRYALSERGREICPNAPLPQEGEREDMKQRVLSPWARDKFKAR